MEQRQLDTGLLRPVRDRRLGLVQRKSRRDRAHILRRIRVPEHDLESVSGFAETGRERRMLHDLAQDAGRGLEICERLEQGDDIEDGRGGALADGVAGEAVHVREVLSRLRERHDVATCRTRTVAVLQELHHAEDLEHLLGELGPLAAGIELVEHLAVHRGVLAHLEFGEVETEGLDLPDQLLQLAVGLPRCAGTDQGVLHHAKVGQQLVRRRVGQISVTGAGRGDLPCRQQHDAAVQLAGGALGDVARRILVGRAEPMPQRRDGVARRRRVDVEGEGASDAEGRALETEQHVLAGDLRRLACHRRRHERVAVTVAADPGSDPHERAHHGGAASGGRSLQRIVDATVDLRDRREQGVVEDRHHGAHLVGGRRLLGPKRAGAPQRVDLLEHLPLGPPLVGAVAQRRVAFLQQLGQTADARGDRSPACFGRVGGEDRVEAQRLQTLEG